ncbi:Protein kinase domain/Protein tyrosine kinase, putative [Angomonas deanei]|uniref:Protein kinase domain/Protein tyrosine kinase, putative n=1 Tax=Angomonas deanei TaxID=59799 RepID=A0A7G2CI63_9TRYP|nr:Protein kinase domain/Protein tyrosine kinase, putative [Angomonas deanei]
MHDRHVTHRDLKPQNLMLKSRENCEPKENGEHYCIKIGDFGLSRIEDIPIKKYAHEAITLWYRSPDVLLGNTNFSYTADAWSTGCIIAEIASGAALFRGRDQEDQLKRVFARIGVPSIEELPDMNNYPYSDDFEEAFEIMQSYGAEEKRKGTFAAEEQAELKRLQTEIICDHQKRCSDVTLQHLAGIKARLRACLTQRGNFDVLGEDGLDLLARFFIYDPKQRMTILEALHHPFLKLGEEVFVSPPPPTTLPGGRNSITSGGSRNSNQGPIVSDSISMVPRPPTSNKSAPSSNKSSTAGLLPHIPQTTCSAEIHAPTATKRNSKTMPSSTAAKKK